MSIISTPLTSGSTYRFKPADSVTYPLALTKYIDGVWIVWDVTGLTVVAIFQDQAGTQTVVAATVVNASSGLVYADFAPVTTGSWTMTWRVTDPNAVPPTVDKTIATPFRVVDAP